MKLCVSFLHKRSIFDPARIEFYAPQPDAFACVDYQRREVAYQNRIRPGKYLFFGIAKVELDEFDWLPHRFLMAITSDVYRLGLRAHGHYEEKNGLATGDI